MPATTTATKIQRNYRNVIKKARKSKQPVVILSNNKPSAVLMDYDTYQERERADEQFILRDRGDLSKYRGLWTKKEAVKFNQVIDEMFEQIDPEIWK